MKYVRFICFIIFVTLLCSGTIYILGKNVKADTEVEINANNFPDAKFRSWILSQPYGADGVLNKSEIDDIKEITFTSDSSITNLKGIQYFSSLESLCCLLNKLEYLDISGLTEIRKLDCEGCSSLEKIEANGCISLELLKCPTQIQYIFLDGCTSLSSLDCITYTKLFTLKVSGCSSIKTLKCQHVSFLDVSGCTSLLTLYCNSGSLRSLDVSECTSLETLTCEGVFYLSSLDVSKNSNLKSLAFTTSINLTSLDVSRCISLEKLICNECFSLSSLNVSKNSKLKTLECAETKLTALDVNGCIALETLNCNLCKSLSNLSVSKNSKLKKLECAETKLTALDVSGCTALETLNCNLCKSLSSLNVSKNSKLKTLECVETKLTTLEVSGCPALETLNCNLCNSLSSLDVSKNTKIKKLECTETNITALDVSGCIALETLNCDVCNSLRILDVSRHTALKTLYCKCLALNNLNVSGCINLTEIDCSDLSLSILDASGCIALKKLDCRNNELKELYVDNDSALELLSCEQNQIIQLDIDDCPNLITAKTFGTYSLDGNIVKYDYKSKYILSHDKATKFVSVSFSLDKKNANIICGKTLKLKATLNGSSSNIVWKSSDTKVATVDSSGKIAAKMAGTVTITAYADRKSAACKVTVLYKDVTDSSDFWYAPTNYLTAKGVVKGYDNQTLFKPANDCTRAQMLTFMWRLQGSPSPKAKTCKFPDVETSDYFFKPVIWAVEKGITTGYDDGTFKPQNVCTRAQTVTFLWRMANKPAPKTTTSKFIDINKKNYFYDAVLWASEKKIVAGYDDNTFRPQGKCLRRQMVTFLYKYDKYVNGKG